MDIKVLEERRHELMNTLCEELNAAQIAAVVRNDEGAPEMISAILDEIGDPDQELEILGDFYFRPVNDEEDTAQAFMCVLTITDELPKERMADFYEALSYVNFNVPAGCFSVDKDHRFFCYVLTSIMPMELPDDLLFHQMDIAVGNACMIADTYIPILCDVLDGTIGVDGVVEFLGGPAEA
ncbi:MAG: hypothetical protein IJT32_06865 [Lachnospiraceae bacterium]|nr:hypothetical protein [Lachnospiraceae bacterium]